MIQITPQMRILVAVEAVDFRRGIDGLARVCREVLRADPFLCGEAEYVAADHEYVTKRLFAWISCARPATHKIYRFSSRLRTASLGRNRRATVPRIAALFRPRRIISTSAAAYRCVVATCACPSHAWIVRRSTPD